jgi:hypothetical protein
MTSQLVERLGSQEPVILHSPPGVVSLAAAEEAIELADAYGVCDGFPLSDSQKLTIRNAGGERADRRWAATRIGNFGPRQGTGKNDAIAAWELAHLRLFGTELIIHTAHEFPTANEAFLRLVAVFEAWDDLRALVKHIYYANGAQSIQLMTGQRILYRARTGGGGRGFAKAGLLVYDEAQHLAREHVAASGPTKMANENSQTWYAGSGGLTTSAVAWGLRRAAMAGTGGRLAYTEMTGEVDGVAPDPSDRDVWYRCIPGLGRWVTEEAVEAMLDELGPELFLREILCVWEAELGNEGALIPSWSQLVDGESQIVSHLQVALDVSPGRNWSTFGAAGRRADGRLHVEAMERVPGTAWVLDYGVERARKWSVPIRIDRQSPAAAFIPLFREQGVEVVEMSTAEHARACGQFIDAAANDAVRHLGQSSLNSAVAGAVLRSAGDAQLWGRRSSRVDITPLVAVTLALGGVPEVTPEAVVFAY